MRSIVLVAALGLIPACAPQIPESGAGFDTSFDQALERDAAIAGARTGGAVPPPKVISQEPLEAASALAVSSESASQTAGATQVASAEAAVARASVSHTDTATQTADDLARETAEALKAASANSGVAPLQASPSNPAPALVGVASLSDENDFQAVSSRESIESDAARIAKNKQSYQSVAATAVPERPSDTGPNLVDYALGTSNTLGVRSYPRTGLNLKARAERNCAKYLSADLAQTAFLSRGGPQRDRLGLDPDGDGFACGWDPRPFRQAVKS